MSEPGYAALQELLTRRETLLRASTAGLGAMVAAALPFVADPPAARATAKARAARSPATVSLTDATMQAFADTMLPGRKVTRTEGGAAVHPLAIAGVDPLPGAVEADALALYGHPEVGFTTLEPAFLADVEARALLHGGPFLNLPFAARVQTCLAGLDFANPTRLLWEAAAAVPFTAFCAAALVTNATEPTACGYRVMGLPGVAPNGYRAFSWRRKLSHERTRTGSLP